MRGRAGRLPWSTYGTGFGLVLLAALVVVAAEGSFRASQFGLKLWFDAVLPALLPFFALSDILAAYGIIHFMAVWLEPIMRPVFNIPGAGGFALAMGLVSGYPLGAMITARLRREGLVNPVEGERLVSLANTADPLFMAGVVAAGFFELPELGATLSFAHYLAVFLVGLAGAYYCRDAPATPPPLRSPALPVWSRAAKAMIEARQADGRPFGAVLGSAIQNAVSSMLLIGGTIVMFSVLLRVLELVGVTGALARLAGAVLGWVGLSPELAQALVRGALEITNGTQAASQASADLVQRAAAASFVIGWSGLSVHAQVAALVQGTGIRIGPYVAARLLHGVLAGGLTALLLHQGLGPALAAVAGGPPPVPLAGLASVAWHLRWAAGLAVLAVAAAVTTAVAMRVVSRLLPPRISGLGRWGR